MKKLILFLGLPIALLLCIPAVMGVALRASDADAILAPLEAQTRLDFTRRSQRAGWFRSEMVFDINSPPHGRGGEPEPSQLVLQIWHGPAFLTTRGLQTGLAYAQVQPALSEPLAQLFSSVMPPGDQLEQLDIHVLAGFGGNWQVTLAADALVFESGNGLITLNDLNAQMDFVVDQELGTVDMQQRMRIEQINPAAPVAAVSWQMQVEDLNAELFSLYAGLMASDPGSPASEQLLAQVAERSTLLLLQHPLAYTAAFAIEAYDGMHEGELAILWPGLALRSLDDFRLGEALRILQVSLRLNGDEAALLRSPLAESIRVYQAQGFAEVSNGKVSVIATLEGGTLTINQQVFPLDPFLAL